MLWIVGCEGGFWVGVLGGVGWLFGWVFNKGCFVGVSLLLLLYFGWCVLVDMVCKVIVKNRFNVCGLFYGCYYWNKIVWMINICKM